MASELSRRPEGVARVPVPASVNELVEARAARLPPVTQRALLAAAALSQPTVTLLGRTALIPAEDEGLVSAEDGRVRFAHPLFAAVAGDTQAALAVLWQAVAEHDRLGALPFDRARTLLVLGRVLRRTGKRAQARAVLTEALTVFQQTRAPGWAKRAEADLGRLGGRGRSSQALTPTEARVAELAAAGLSNREIAEQAFLTVKTVEANLTRVYRKLTVRSRTALTHALGHAGQPPA